MKLHPFQGAFFPDPDVPNNQDGQKNYDLEQTEQTKGFELDRPREKKNRLDIEDYEQDCDDVVTDGVASACAIDGVDAAFVGHQLRLARIRRPDQFSQQQSDRKKGTDDSDEYKNWNVVLRHKRAMRGTRTY